MQYDPKLIPEEFAEVVLLFFKRGSEVIAFSPLSWRHKIALVGILDFEGSTIEKKCSKSYIFNSSITNLPLPCNYKWQNCHSHCICFLLCVHFIISFENRMLSLK